MYRSSVMLGASLAVGLSFGAAANAASISFNDTVPGEITINHDGNFEGGATSNGTVFAPFVGGSTTAFGEVATFTGTWIVSTPGTGGTGVIYFVDPVATNVVCARMDATWSVGTSFPTINFTITSAPAGSDLGTLPAHFAGLGVPITAGFSSFSGKFRNPATAAPVSEPSNMGKTFASDAFPKCADPVLYSQPTNSADAKPSDLDSTTDTISAETVTFAQDVIVRSIRWWGVYVFTNTPQSDADEFTLRVFEDSGGSPAAAPIASYHLSNTIRGGTTMTVAGFPEFIYAADLTVPLTLEGGKTYWLSIINNTVADTDDDWWWVDGAGGDNSTALQYTHSAGGPWTNESRDRAYELCGVPCTLDCQPDINGDGFVDGADLAALLASWGVCPAPAPLLAPVDDRRDVLLNPTDDSSLGAARRR